ncbi:MAG TPA: hypothetical protein VNH11_08690 [Pirellulales bacterium]|nr:hypothetical protein [Pirellulales bacterium]
MKNDSPPPAVPQRAAELTSWAVVYMLLGWLSLLAGIFGGAGETPFYLGAGVVLLPLGLGFWFRWRWSRWAGLAFFAAVAAWAVWQILHQRLWFLSLALLLTSVETLLCLRRWPGMRG